MKALLAIAGGILLASIASAEAHQRKECWVKEHVMLGWWNWRNTCEQQLVGVRIGVTKDGRPIIRRSRQVATVQPECNRSLLFGTCKEPEGQRNAGNTNSNRGGRASNAGNTGGVQGPASSPSESAPAAPSISRNADSGNNVSVAGPPGPKGDAGPPGPPGKDAEPNKPEKPSYEKPDKEKQHGRKGRGGRSHGGHNRGHGRRH